MLPVRRVSQHTAVSYLGVESHLLQRWFSDDRRPPNGIRNRFNPARKSKGQKIVDPPTQAAPIEAETQTKDREPSLVEQLFPEIAKRHEEQEVASHEVPRVPLPKVLADDSSTSAANIAKQQRHKTEKKPWLARQYEAEIEATGPGSAVLVLRNASPNLTEEDFRRLVPQGQHLEGWRLEQGDIVKVIPGRNLANLAQQNAYYLLFTSALHAFTYQGHVQRIHNLAALHTPSSTKSPIPPPPGYMIEGLDAHAAIQAYTLVPPTQKLELRQLKPPLSPVMQNLVRHHGFESIHARSDRMPFEVRLEMEGPQLGPSMVRHIIMESGRARGLGWTGGEGLNIKVTRWAPRSMPSPLRNDERAFNALPQERTEDEQASLDLFRLNRTSQDPKYAELKRRTPAEVYVLGFHTERAAQSFVAYWHRRPLEMSQPEDAAEWDSPPIANASMLW